MPPNTMNLTSEPLPLRIMCNLTEFEMAERLESTMAQLEVYETFVWWTECIAQSIIGIAGIIANTVAIPILCSKKMYSIFNRLLVFLAIFDNVFIVCQLLEAKRKMTNNFKGHYAFDQIHEHVFGYFLYPLHAFVLTASIYITVALALERYRAVWRPVEYHNKYKGVNPWKRILKFYVGPVVVFSVIFCIPKYFEIEFEEELGFFELENITNTNSTIPMNMTSRSTTKPTEFRMNDIYVLLYCNIARLLVQGIIPFFSLSFLNYRIYWVIKRRRQLKNRPRLESSESPHNQPENQHGIEVTINGTQGENLLNISTNPICRASFSAERKENEAKHAVILFIIVILFFICHTPRVIINIHEFINLDLLKRGMESECDTYPILAFIFTSVSNCILTLNSSCNFYIYCFMCPTFRSVLYDWVFGGCSRFRERFFQRKTSSRASAQCVTFSTTDNPIRDENTVKDKGNSPIKIDANVALIGIPFNDPDDILVANENIE